MHKHATILIVDDVKPNRLVVKSYLANNDYDFLLADGGRQALDLLEHEDVDLILLDIMMPDIDGIEVLKQIRVNERLRHIPVIMVTAMGAEDALPECLELGASDYVTKPINSPILKARVHTQLSRKQAMDEVQQSRLHLTHMVEEKTRELNQTMRKLYQAQKLEAIGTLAGGIAHDFNNVLSNITGNLFLLKQHAGDDDYINRRIGILDGVCMQAGEHIRQLLCFARKESVAMGAVDMAACAQAGCDMASMAIPGGIDLTFIHPDGKIIGHWNDTQLQQVLLNLITNASHAVEDVESPTIRVELSLFQNNQTFRGAHPDMQDECYAGLSVRDNGCGIAADDQEKIFEPFFTTKEQGKGTGLGLSMAFGSVNNAGGVIEVNSEPGNGTQFTMYLPIEPS